MSNPLINKISLKEALEIIQAVRAEASKNQEYGFCDDFDTFIMKMLCLNPQSYGSRIEKFLIKRFGLTGIRASENRGDFKDQFEQHQEIKASLITLTNSDLNLVQIRQWQDIAGYYCVAIDTRVIPFKEMVFVVTKDQMSEELLQMKATAAHGTMSANSNNKNIELRLSIPIKDGNKDFERWKKLYLRQIKLNKDSIKDKN